MQYIIHSNIIFDTTEYILKSLHNDNNLIKLSNSSGRILEELIKHRHTGSPVTREHLFTVVWKSYGLEPSHGNLNQQISLIRKNLAIFGVDSSSILTIPKRGLKLNNQLTIKQIENDPENNYISPNQYAHDSTKSNIDKNDNITSRNSNPFHTQTYIKYIITLIITLFFVFTIGFIYLYNKTNSIKLYCCKEINSCNICTFPIISEFEFQNNET
ncbi:conserved hypothetical protein [Candidatus Blochmanniella vafra str. BVAF]|uniref:OmpR/PhoB-type domain-containing protein n=1 Tax=Blochmanniella vafra (strain BVAF) TaxID=859654 RepID=E8Q692_BLOVB|nr:winged helix-turn-helix domain-containing protein [Candidatus Blochmannia vafer]ADV33786.1 conserved hypothetical protein [Candidatus Blochmannia vafer str. BVAF]